MDMKKFYRILLPLVVVLFVAKGTSAQEGAYYDQESDYEGWNIALMTGFSQFYGDVSQYGFFEKLNNESKISWGVIVGKEITPWFHLRGQMLGGRLKSYQDLFDDGRPANLFLDTKYFEAGINGRFNLSQLWMDVTPEKRWEVYGVAGLSFATWDALLMDAVTRNEIDPSADRVHAGVTFPVGLGFEYRVYENWHVFTEWTYRFVASEKVDLVQGGFRSDPFLNIGFGVNYKFGDIFESSAQADRPDDRRSDPQDREYRRLDFEGPDIVEISTDNACTNTDLNRSADGSRQQVTQEAEEQASQRRQREMQDAMGRNNRESSSSGNNRSAAAFDEGLVFSVQVLAVSKPADISEWKQQYNIRRNINEMYSGGIYRYLAGTFDSYYAAEAYADIARTKGVSDAFVVAVRNGQRVRLTTQMKQGSR